MKRVILIILLIVVVLALIGAVVLWWLSPTTQEEVGTIGETIIEADEIAEPLYLSIGTFIANLAQSRRYVKTSIELLLSDAEAWAFLNQRTVEVRDLVLRELQSLTPEQLRDSEQVIILKQNIITRIETLFPPNPPWKDPFPIKKVLITEFYLQ